MKLFAGGPQDIADARYVLESASESANADLLRELALRYGPDTVRSMESALNELQRGLDSDLELD